jgi:hypothetical protein
MSTSYLVWLNQEFSLRDATPQTYSSVLYEVVKLLIEDAKERAIQEEDCE